MKRLEKKIMDFFMELELSAQENFYRSLKRVSTHSKLVS